MEGSTEGRSSDNGVLSATVLTRDAESSSQVVGNSANIIDQLPTPRDQKPKASSTMIQRTQINNDVTVIDVEDDDEITVISMVSSATMNQGKSQMQELETQKVEAEKRKKNS